ncbi:glycoside hydrolase family 1 protein [Terricaulis silvestris]|uniref:Beta-glucosidase n=1 Tax=Terricaulis silvestris TaxID=2686094 RepID=A0A6I6MSS5_9CAUL|nr:family 1 glycosylhydrolase [Terricaulis silvestris]QGZ94732.1 Beta-glucosidase [Terricaulis silvestris]
MGVTRRDLALGAGAVALAGCTRTGDLFMPAPRERQFPADFLWGVASSAYQIEGALDADGRGRSIWDVFPRERIHDGSDAAIANDSYHRAAEDVALIADAGLNAYRFSISWPRTVPDGESAQQLTPGGWDGFNRAGVDYYSRLIDALLARGVTPYATLFHWDLPLQLQERGGWTSRDTAQRFADYASVVSETLGDRLKHIVVLNEAAVHAVVGHVIGEHAPGLRDADQLGAVIHHQNLAQGLAIQAMRAGRSDLIIGTTMALMPSRPQKAVVPWLNELAAKGFDEIWNGAFLDPLFKGSYPGAAADMVESVVRPGDLAITRQAVDFLGVNYYSPSYMRFNASAPSFIEAGDPPEGVERDAFNRHVDPSGLYEVLVRLRSDYGNPRVLITENGCSDPFSDGPADLEDDFRVDYVRRHLEAVKSAMEAGSDIGGYFHWTLVDNWEWAEGYRSKFGLVAQDRATGARTPKQSYAWFSALARSGALDA